LLLYLAQIGTTNSKPGATNSKAAETKSKEIDRKSKPKTTKTKLDFLPQIEPFQGVALTFGARRHKVELPPSMPRRSGAGAAGRAKRLSSMSIIRSV
jgi:hypothetical protein